MISGTKHDFVLEVTETQNLPQLQITHQKPDDAYVLVLGLVKIPENDRQKLKNLDLEKFNQLIWDTKLTLLKIGVDFTVRGPEKDPDAWEIQKRLYIDQASTQQFHDIYSKVKNAIISVIWAYKKALDTTT